MNLICDLSRSADEILSLLTGAPARISKLTTDLSPTNLLAPPESDALLMRDLLAHLRSCSGVWDKHIVLILRGDHPNFKAVSLTTWIKQMGYRERPSESPFHAFSIQRTELIGMCTLLGPEDAWSVRSSGGEPQLG